MPPKSLINLAPPISNKIEVLVLVLAYVTQESKIQETLRFWLMQHLINLNLNKKVRSIIKDDDYFICKYLSTYLKTSK